MKINEDSLKWAIEHLCEYGDTDLFPSPFEFKIISENKESVFNRIKDIDIGNYNFSSSRRFMIPKDELSYRIATQLNPIDSILFSAIIHQFGSLIEVKRASIENVFSYRFSPDIDGKLYSNRGTWENYWIKCEEKAYKYQFVAYLDISDFYNQIYHHTIENQLIECGLPNQAIKFILNLLSFLTQKNSRGIPIGPHVSHLLAELSLIPVDESISLKGFEYCRYVDDFVVFTDNYEDARMVFYHLAETLDKQQRLVIQRQKSKIIKSDEFLRICSNMKIDDPINETEQEILDVIREHSEDAYSTIKLSDLEPEDLEVLSFDNINDLLNEYIRQTNPNYSRIRWLYRRLAQVGIEHAVDFSITNMKKLIPAINDVCLYLSSASSYYQNDWKEVAERIIELLELPIIKSNEYFKIVLLNLFVRNSRMNHFSSLLEIYRYSSSSIKRKVILTGAQNNATAWIRELKEDYENFDDWNKNAYILATACLPKEERRFLLQSIKEKSHRKSKLEEILIEWAKNK
jgi:hypothetical protein